MQNTFMIKCNKKSKKMDMDRERNGTKMEKLPQKA